MKLRLILLTAIIVALAVAGAGWKWQSPPTKTSGPHTYRIAAWSWNQTWPGPRRGRHFRPLI